MSTARTQPFSYLFKGKTYFRYFCNGENAWQTLIFVLALYFYQRKNGLFKKAYELGVLCSVDVAVIIFGECGPSSCLCDLVHARFRFTYLFSEERPGHHVKLYQYCSGNIDDVVQRHSRVNFF